jgi:nucleotide-binding universal stress UspA family protein
MNLRTIVVPTDCSELSRSALRYASAIAGRTGAAIVAVYGANVSSHPDGEGVAGALACRDDVESMMLPIRACMQEAIESSVAEPARCEIVVRDQAPAAAIVELADEREAGLIVMAASDRNRVMRAILGSVTDAVLERSHRPVLIVHERSGAGVRRILCPFRDTPQSAAAVREAVRLTKAFGAELVLAHVTESDEPAPLPAAIQAQVDGTTNFLLRTLTCEVATAAAQVVALADELQADLIVAGTRRPDLVRMAPCAVLTVTAA